MIVSLDTVFFPAKIEGVGERHILGGASVHIKAFGSTPIPLQRQISTEGIGGPYPLSMLGRTLGYICEKCKLRIVFHENAAADLKEFKETARCSRSALDRARGPLKRPKSTSSHLGVSPDTARERLRNIKSLTQHWS